MQQRLGEVGQADRTVRGIHAEIPTVAAEFLERQETLVVSSRTASGQVWASPLVGTPGFAMVPRPDRLRLDARLTDDDPLAATLAAESSLVGVLGLEPPTRRRIRINGLARSADRGWDIEVHQAFSNCPRFIQKREVSARRPVSAEPVRGPVRCGSSLTGLQQAWLRAADTFFLGTTDADGNADASHRGGNPGFVEVPDSGSVRFHDYAGNHMYMTLGNLEVQSSAGLLFLDWSNGSTLQIAGVAAVSYGPQGRTVNVSVTDVVEMTGRLPLRWGPAEMSRFNP